MNFSYFKEKKLYLKKYILSTAIALIPILTLEAQNYANIEFIENKGQWDSKVKFKGEVDAGAIFVRAGGFTILQHNQQDLNVIQEMLHNHPLGGGNEKNPGQ